MREEPRSKRCIAYFDGQNLFHAARDAFGYTFPNYDPFLLASEICSHQDWKLSEIRFYTGIPSELDRPDWNRFWVSKLAVMGTKGIRTFSRPLRYRNQTIRNQDGTTLSIPVGQEKGVDVRIALDLLRDAIDARYDIGLLFSQDQDFSEVADDVRTISMRDDRWIKLACAFPVSPTVQTKRGVNGTDWIKIDRALYDRCIDPKDYRSRKNP